METLQIRSGEFYSKLIEARVQGRRFCVRLAQGVDEVPDEVRNSHGLKLKEWEALVDLNRIIIHLVGREACAFRIGGFYLEREGVTIALRLIEYIRLRFPQVMIWLDYGDDPGLVTRSKAEASISRLILPGNIPRLISWDEYLSGRSVFCCQKGAMDFIVEVPSRVVLASEGRRQVAEANELLSGTRLRRGNLVMV